MSAHSINLIQALAYLNDVIYQPTAEKKGDKFLLSNEQKELLQLRENLKQIVSTTEKSLNLSNQVTFDQEAIMAIHIANLKKSFDYIVPKLKQIIADCEKKSKQKIFSSKFQDCLSKLSKILGNSIEIMEKEQTKYISTVEHEIAKSNLFALCKELGVLYIPISQGLDPLIGGEEENGKVVLSGGHCAGKVISWIEACSKEAKITYPFYGKKFEGVHQEEQIKTKKNYKLKYCDEFSAESVNQIVKNLSRNKLYYSGIFSLKGGGHAIGMRIRQDGIFEIFDSNDAHIFCYSEDDFKNVLGLMFTQYAVAYEFDKFALYEADALQYNSENNLFPHKLHVIQASKKAITTQSDAAISRLIRNLYNDVNRKFKKDASRQKALFDLFIGSIVKICDLIHSPETITTLIQGIQKFQPKDNFMSNEQNKKTILDIFNDRLKVIQSPEFQNKFAEQKEAINEINRIEGDLTQELNQVRDEIGKEKDNSKLAALTKKSIGFWHFLNKIKVSDVAVSVRKILPKNIGTTVKNFFTKTISSLFGIKKTPSPAEKISQTVKSQVAIDIGNVYSLLQKDSKELEKVSMLSINLEKISVVLKELSLQTNLNASSMNSQQKAYWLAYDQLFKENAKHISDELITLVNDLKLTGDRFSVEKSLLDLLDLNAGQLKDLQEKNIDEGLMKEHLLALIKGKITEKAIEEEKNKNNVDGGLQSDQENFLTSLQKIIDYLGGLKDEFYASSLTAMKNTSRDANTLISKHKLMQKVEHYDKKIKELIAVKNNILKHRQDENLFVALGANIKKEYAALFPVDFCLVENYSALLDKMFQRNQPLVFSEDDKKEVKQLAATFEALKIILVEIDRGIQKNTVIESQPKIKFKSDLDIFLSRFNAEDARQIKIILEHFKKVFTHLKDEETDIHKIINEVKPFLPLQNGKFDWDRLLSTKDASLIFWKAPVAEIQRTYNAIVYTPIFLNDVKEMIIESEFSILPKEIVAAVRKIASNLEADLVFKFAEEQGRPSLQKLAKVFGIFPCIYKMEKPDGMLMDQNFYTYLSNSEEMKKAMSANQPAIKTRLGELLQATLTLTNAHSVTGIKLANLLDDINDNSFPIQTFNDLLRFRGTVNEIVGQKFIDNSFNIDASCFPYAVTASPMMAK